MCRMCVYHCCIAVTFTTIDWSIFDPLQNPVLQVLPFIKCMMELNAPFNNVKSILFYQTFDEWWDIRFPFSELCNLQYVEILQFVEF